jgi:hypothetical protein
MNPLLGVLKEVMGLFVDDGALALSIVAIVALAGITAALMPAVPAASGAILLLGCLAALFANVMRSRRK